eukprot:TRINITY_DN8630_c0_g2_i2.p1 TRINITY_DN8630_c0_g2~~TRINITY_DN8630_c0_g2_i2.p1  ORF type:complete len:1352 (+),score=295.09 TRINITY_DN8630_c0_g2_i2:109-4164(+)
MSSATNVTEYIVKQGIQKCVDSGSNSTVCSVPTATAYLEDGNEGNTEIALAMMCIGVVWCAGWVVIAKYTVEDGYLEGTRCVESRDSPTQRSVLSFVIFALEMPQLMAVSFSLALSNGYSTSMSSIQETLHYWLLIVPGEREPVFFTLILFVAFATLLLYYPVFLAVISPKRYTAFVEALSYGHVLVLEWTRDVYLYVVPLPVFVHLVYPYFCSYYEEAPLGLGEDPTMYGYTDIKCWGDAHFTRMVIGLIFFAIYYAGSLAASAIPVMVRKTTDLQVHGRYTAATIQIKLWLALMLCGFGRNHKWWHLMTTLPALVSLFALGITMRPYLVERVNFQRACMCMFSVWVCIANIFVAGMDDPTATTPLRMAVFGTLILFFMCAIRYILIPETKVFPPIASEGGTYEGGISLGTLWRHGYGTQHWEDKAEYVGSWWLGEITGKGVLRLANLMYYEGHWIKGNRHGFGKTTIVGDDEVEYEGYFKNDVFEGFGKKTYKDREVYEGSWHKGKEHGRGVWHFSDGSTLHAIWVDGLITLPDDAHLTKDVVQGPKRYGVQHGLGKRTYEDGGLYEGSFCAGARHGDGHMKYADGSEYMGSWSNNMRHGEGVQEELNGDSYDGYFKNDKPDGYGAHTTDEVYEGNFQNGIRTGYGKCTSPDGTSYVGSWQDGMYSGMGLVIYPNSDEYEGSWLKGKRHGNPGSYRFSNGDVYHGEFVGDTLNGEGELILADVGTYNGPFKDGKREGKGVFEWLDGSIYEGEWSSSRMNGQGVMSFRSDLPVSSIRDASISVSIFMSSPDDEDPVPHEDAVARSAGGAPVLVGIVGGKYEGTWADGKMHGSGKVVFADGSHYEGDWAFNRPQGKGTRHYASGDVYKGAWHDGRRQGIGELTHLDGRVFLGQFANDLRHGAGKLSHTSSSNVTRGYWHNDMYVGPSLEHFTASCAKPAFHPLMPEVAATETESVPPTLDGTCHEFESIGIPAPIDTLALEEPETVLNKEPKLEKLMTQEAQAEEAQEGGEARVIVTEEPEKAHEEAQPREEDEAEQQAVPVEGGEQIAKREKAKKKKKKDRKKKEKLATASPSPSATPPKHAETPETSPDQAEMLPAQASPTQAETPETSPARAEMPALAEELPAQTETPSTLTLPAPGQDETPPTQAEELPAQNETSTQAETETPPTQLPHVEPRPSTQTETPQNEELPAQTGELPAQVEAVPPVQAEVSAQDEIPVEAPPAQAEALQTQTEPVLPEQAEASLVETPAPAEPETTSTQAEEAPQQDVQVKEKKELKQEAEETQGQESVPPAEGAQAEPKESEVQPVPEAAEAGVPKAEDSAINEEIQPSPVAQPKNGEALSEGHPEPQE